MLPVDESGLWRLIMTFGTAPLNVYLISCSEPPVHALLAIASFLSDPNSSAWDTCDVLVSRAGLVECRNAIAAALPHADAAAPRDDGPRRCNISATRTVRNSRAPRWRCFRFLCFRTAYWKIAYTSSKEYSSPNPSAENDPLRIHPA